MSRKTIYAFSAGFMAVVALALLIITVVIPGITKKSDALVATPVAPSGGITVHGHWAVDVLDPDGTLVEHREFDNALEGGGKEILANLLARKVSPGPWSLKVADSPQPCLNNGQASYGYICEANQNISGTYVFKNLTVALSGSGADAKLLLSGSLTAAVASNISSVSTHLEGSNGNVSPQDAASPGANLIFATDFTKATVSPAIAVQAGQQVQVTVQISFQ